jgi:NUMOD3 motif
VVLRPQDWKAQEERRQEERVSSGRYRPLTQEHRAKISSANTGKTMGPQTDEHRRWGARCAGRLAFSNKGS